MLIISTSQPLVLGLILVWACQENASRRPTCLHGSHPKPDWEYKMRGGFGESCPQLLFLLSLLKQLPKSKCRLGSFCGKATEALEEVIS